MSELSRLRGSEGYKVRDDEGAKRRVLHAVFPLDPRRRGALTDIGKPFRRTVRMVKAVYGA